MTRKIICILGMHRSGTSMVTRLLNICGLYLGEERDLLGPNLGNDKGHWENKEVLDINEEILERFNGSWDSPPIFPAEWENGSGLIDLVTRAEIFVTEMSRHSDIWGFKDPRTCLTLPFWQKVIPHMSYIIPVRDPFEVASSLHNRDGMLIEKGLLLWHYYWKYIREQTVKENKIFTITENYFTDWQLEMRKLIGFIDHPSLEMLGKENKLQDFIDPHLYHEKNNNKDQCDIDESYPVHYLIRQADVIINQFYDSFCLNNMQKEALEKRLEEREIEFAEVSQRLEEREIEFAEVSQKLEEREIEFAEVSQRLEEREIEFTDVSQRLEEREIEFTEVSQRLEVKIQEVDFMQSSKFWRLRNNYCELKNNILNKNIFFSYRLIIQKAYWISCFFKSVVSKIKRHGGYRKSFQEAIKAYRFEGFQGIRRRIRQLLPTSDENQDHQSLPPFLCEPIKARAEQLLELRVLIVAELSIPQCTKYRVKQKIEMLQSIGIHCSVYSWTDYVSCRNALHTNSLVIFYRVPGYDSVLELIAEAKRMNIPTIWEVDDLIFDRDLLSNSRSLTTLDKIVFEQLLVGADLYRKALIACDMGIASTPDLAAAMSAAGLKKVFVIENALDNQTLSCAEKIILGKNENPGNGSDEFIRIVYASGTNTHDIDFEEVADALLKVLQKYDNVKFRLIGPVKLPVAFISFEKKIERIPFCDYEQFLSYLAESDINIVPLEKTIFNDAKSNIKFLEASILQIPSVCSNRAAFRQVISDGINGYLCKTAQDFQVKIERLIDEVSERQIMGASACTFVRDMYSVNGIVNRQILPFIENFKEKQKTSKRILSVNIFYNPRSFGGATIVAEEVNNLLHGLNNFFIYVFTTLPLNVAPAYEVRRYELPNGICVFGMGLPEVDAKAEWENTETLKVFAEVISAVKPDLVHLHCLQGIGASVADLCLANNIPYIITLHDAWWLCGRQFMINQKGRYCDQEAIDTKICGNCVDDAGLNNKRQRKLRSVLSDAAILLTPSRFFADLYIKNGITPEKIKVHKNGIRKPRSLKKIRTGNSLKFGYVGGNTDIKGVHLVKKVFAEVRNLNIRLVVVDNAMNLGYRSYSQDTFGSAEKVDFVPAYNQDNIDEFMNSIDVLLFPTQWKESFGLTIREATARDVWVITTDAGGVVEDIIPEKNGFIIPLYDDGTLLKKAMLKTIDYYNRAHSPGQEIYLEKGKIRWFEEQANELARIYDSVLNRVQYFS